MRRYGAPSRHPEVVFLIQVERAVADLGHQANRVMCLSWTMWPLCKDLRAVVQDVNAREFLPGNLDNGTFSCCGFHAIRWTVTKPNHHATLAPLRPRRL